MQLIIDEPTTPVSRLSRASSIRPNTDYTLIGLDYFFPDTDVDIIMDALNGMRRETLSAEVL